MTSGITHVTRDLFFTLIEQVPWPAVAASAEIMPVLEVPLRAAASPESARAYVQSKLAPFFAESINPDAAERDTRDLPFSAAAFQPVVDLGLLGFLLPRELGGSGGDRRTFG